MKILIIGLICIVCFFLIIGLRISLVGCAKTVSTEYENVEVTIVDEYHQEAYTTPIMCGKVITVIAHPAVYQITVEYNDVEYIIDRCDTYNKYKNKVGQTTMGILEIRTYDNGTVKYDIAELQ